MVDAWAVAAAVLVEAGAELHYNTITSRVLSTGLSRLASVGKTPEQTIGATMRTYRNCGRALFKSTGNGWYFLHNVEQTKRIPQVRQVLETLQRRRGSEQGGRIAPTSPADEIALLRAEVKLLKQQNANLVAKLKQIVGICEMAGS